MEVTANADDTYTVVCTAAELRVLARWATDQTPAVTAAAQIADVLTVALTNRVEYYRHVDAPTLHARYEKLSPEQKARVDDMLRGETAAAARKRASKAKAASQ